MSGYFEADSPVEAFSTAIDYWDPDPDWLPWCEIIVTMEDARES